MIHAHRPATSVLLAGLLFAGGSAFAAERDHALYDAASAQQDAVIGTLETLVKIESGSADHAGLDKIALYLGERLRALGASVEAIPSTTEGGVDLVQGTLHGTGQLRIMLIAHTDTVYDQGILTREPYRREGNQLFGPGIADDKGGVAVILHALGLLHERGWSDYAQVTVLFNPDEEIGSAGSGESIARLADQHDVVLSFEPSPAKAVADAEGVLLAAAGTSQVWLNVEGRAAHAGAAPEQGRNALVELSHQILRTRDIAAEVPGTQLNWTTTTAGSVRNQIPHAAQAGADVRVTEIDANERLLAALQAKVGEDPLIPDTTTTVELVPMRPIYVAGERGRALADLATHIYAELDGRPLLLIPSTNGGTDAGFAGRSGKAAVLEGLGLAGWGYHARDEYIEVDSIAPRLYLTARMLIELSGHPAETAR